MTRILPGHHKIPPFKFNQLSLIQAMRDNKILLSLHLLAVIFLLLPALPPVATQVFASRSRASGSFHDHRLYGCSPERIADHPCHKKIRHSCKAAP
jgi:hypothetical protein